MHPEIEKFWSGEGVSFFIMENPANPYEIGSEMNILYCRNVRVSEFYSTYTVVAKSLPYPKGIKVTDISAKIYYLNRGNAREFSKKYSEAEMLRIVRLKLFL